MRKFITFIITAIILAVSAISCNSRKSAMENIIVENLKSPSTYKMASFNEVYSITFDTELAGLTKFYSNQIDFDREQVNKYQKDVAFYQKMDKKYGGYKESIKIYQDGYNREKEKLAKDSTILNYLVGIRDNATPNELSKVTYTMCKLEYDAQNSFGAVVRDVSEGRFNSKGELVAIKLTEESDWNIFGDYYSVPNYYEMIK